MADNQEYIYLISYEPFNQHELLTLHTEYRMNSRHQHTQSECDSHPPQGPYA